jgi:hypothetical protein
MLRPQGFIVPIVPHNIRHRALHLLFGSPDGCTTRVLLMHGITFDMLVDMVESGMVTIERWAMRPCESPRRDGRA